MRASDYTFPVDWEIGMYPGFDTVELKRQIQAEIYEETKHLTPEQIRERRRRVVERADKRRAALVGTDK
jgi:hypothetical protein